MSVPREVVSLSQLLRNRRRPGLQRRNVQHTPAAIVTKRPPTLVGYESQHMLQSSGNRPFAEGYCTNTRPSPQEFGSGSQWMDSQDFSCNTTLSQSSVSQLSQSQYVYQSSQEDAFQRSQSQLQSQGKRIGGRAKYASRDEQKASFYSQRFHQPSQTVSIPATQPRLDDAEVTYEDNLPQPSEASTNDVDTSRAQELPVECPVLDKEGASSSLQTSMPEACETTTNSSGNVDFKNEFQALHESLSDLKDGLRKEQRAMKGQFSARMTRFSKDIRELQAQVDDVRQEYRNMASEIASESSKLREELGKLQARFDTFDYLARASAYDTRQLVLEQRDRHERETVPPPEMARSLTEIAQDALHTVDVDNDHVSSNRTHSLLSPSLPGQIDGPAIISQSQGSEVEEASHGARRNASQADRHTRGLKEALALIEEARSKRRRLSTE